VTDLPVKRKLLTGTSVSNSPECVIPDDVLIQSGPPDDEHLLLETCRGVNKYIKKECIKLVISRNSKYNFVLFRDIKYMEGHYFI
jgi:hypothetical protein